MTIKFLINHTSEVLKLDGNLQAVTARWLGSLLTFSSFS